MDKETYKEKYDLSISNPDTFWSSESEKFLDWFAPWEKVKSITQEKGDVRWFEGGKINACYNCIDRHVLSGYGDNVAYFFEANDGTSKTITYSDLLAEVSKFANVLKGRGIKKGDRVCIYMPMIPEAVVAMLACARIGAVHTVVFGGFSAEGLLSRINDCECSLVVTADEGQRGEKVVALREKVDQILPKCKSVHTVVVVQNSQKDVDESEVVVDYKKALIQASDVCDCEHMDAEDPLFILYTSGSTGKPKGVLHTTGGYLLYAAMTHKYTFDLQEDDVYWCSADVGWITGHSYIVYGPLINRTKSVVFGGTLNYPSPSRYWDIVDKYKVSIFYSTPTAIRTLMAYGDEYVKKTDRGSLRILGTVGEPINPEAWRWYHEVVGNERCFIVDTWWQTETGGHAITPIPYVCTPKPGAAMMPFFGIEPVIVDQEGSELAGEAEGILLIKGEWPGKLRTLYKDHERFLKTYLKPFAGYYYPGDGARRDAGGCLWITGRVDDTLNISGRLIGTAEVESAIVLHASIAEAAVVAVEHPIKGWSVCAYVVCVHDYEYNENTVSEIIELVKKQVGSFAKPERVVFVKQLPKTRSGKIMRRIVRKIANMQFEELGDISTLAEPAAVEELVEATKQQ